MDDIEQMLQEWACECGKSKGASPELCSNPKAFGAFFMMFGHNWVICSCVCHKEGENTLGIWRVKDKLQ